MQWLPGGRFVEGELIFDSVFDRESSGANSDECPRDEIARELIFNYVRAYVKDRRTPPAVDSGRAHIFQARFQIEF